ncbi:MAG: AAA family ATPase [Candidatus Aegiribacteria sp.]|nr:AAA family ATPase [Candidatus Aegiribacteria sp.]
MKRKAIRELEAWKRKPSRKPMLLQGVRQCGKTYLLKQLFAPSFPGYHYFDLEKNTAAASVFRKGSLDPARILKELELVSDTNISPNRDLIIFDEIQACPRALTALKYFCDDMADCYICAAGSLSGVTMSDQPFPVGKLEYTDLYSMNFMEFLDALEEERLKNSLQNAIEEESLPEAAHDKLWNILGEYIVVGGMPEAVKAYRSIRRESLRTAFAEARKVQENLIRGYLADMAKYSGHSNSMHIERIWSNLPSQLGREQNGNSSRYRFKGVIPGRKGFRGLEGPIDWLEKTGLVLKYSIVNRGELPLSAYTAQGRFKLYAHDTGILGALADIPLLDRGGFHEGFYKGWVAESFVAQEFSAAGVEPNIAWKENTAEVEFLLQKRNDVIPVEVKAGRRSHSRSAGTFAGKYDPPEIVKLGYWNFRKRGITRFIPLYAASMLNTQFTENNPQTHF